MSRKAPVLRRISARLHSDGFRHRDLDMVDAVAVPDRLEQAVGEAQRHDVLHRLFPRK
jgi:hypothetical protein